MQVAMSHSLRHTAAASRELTDIRRAIPTLLAGRVSDLLVPYSAMRVMLYHLNLYLSNSTSRLRIAVSDVNHYYHEAKAIYVLNADEMLISVQCLLTTPGQQFSVLQITPIPLLVPNAPEYHTLLYYKFRVLLVSRDHIMELPERFELMARLKVVDLDKLPLQLKQKQESKCVVSLFEYNATAIVQYCQYQVIDEPLPTSIIKLSPTEWLLTNVIKLTITSKNRTVFSTSAGKQTQTVLFTPCECEIQIDGFKAVTNGRLCDTADSNNETIRLLFTINFIYVKQLFGNEVTKSIDSSKLYHTCPQIEAPQLRIERPKPIHVIANSESKRYNLTAVLTTFKERHPLRASGQVSRESGLSDNNQGMHSYTSDIKDSFLAFLTSTSVILLIAVIFLLVQLKRANMNKFKEASPGMIAMTEVA